MFCVLALLVLVLVLVVAVHLLLTHTCLETIGFDLLIGFLTARAMGRGGGKGGRAFIAQKLNPAQASVSFEPSEVGIRRKKHTP